MRGELALSPQLLLHLQTNAGNRAVRRLLERRAAAADVETSESMELVVAPETAPVPVPAASAGQSWWRRLWRRRQLRLPAPEALPARAGRNAN